jgi:hypothetical protein
LNKFWLVPIIFQNQNLLKVGDVMMMMFHKIIKEIKTFNNIIKNTKNNYYYYYIKSNKKSELKYQDNKKELKNQSTFEQNNNIKEIYLILKTII